MAIALPSFIRAPHSSLRPPCFPAGFLTEAPSSSLSSSLSQFFPCSATNLSSSRGLDCRMPKQSSLRSTDHAFVPAIQEVCDDQAQLARRTTASKDSNSQTDCLIESSVNSGKNQNICNLDARHGGAVVEFRKEEGNGIINVSGGLNNDCIGKMTVATTQAQVEIDKATSLDGSCAETKEYFSGEKQTIEEGIINASGDDGDEVLSPALLAREISRRRNFAIISHPDAGKTTFTEKLLLYGGAIHQAGAVKARRAARHATSDWMELEKQRGISITSTALVFETSGSHITLLDTPGHQDFGEDTYRTLAAADNAVMLVDAGKGLEPQTRKLFEVCRMRKLPIFTFINKLDRPALEPLDLLDQIEKEFGLLTHPVSWPIGSGDRFVGVYYRPRKEVHLFEKDKSHGSREATVQKLSWGDPTLKHIIAGDLYEQLQEEIELLESLTSPLDKEKIHAGDLTPVYFGSAMNNFGVEIFLESFLENSMQPIKHDSDIGDIHPNYPHFTGFIFKLQANMDPKHRDKVAFVRICSGQFRKGMKVKVGRTGKSISLTRPQKMFAQDRSTVEMGFAGDVIGLNNPNTFCIGDTIYCGPKLSYPGIPSFSPELFCYMRNPNPSKYKQFQKGISELLGEGAVQVLYSVDSGRSDPILAAVGQLQFEVVQYRMLNEYGVETQLEPLPYTVARWVVEGWPAIEKAGKIYSCATVRDQWGRPVLLFRNEWNLLQLLNDNKDIGDLVACALPPDEQSPR